MKITIEPFTGTSMMRNADGTDRKVKFDQYRVRVDGNHAGYLGFSVGSKLMLTEKFSPIQVAEIEKSVAQLVGNENQETEVVPDVPAELLEENNPSEEWEDDENDFDS